ncbi:MAG TPA: YggS family pyridoxal phosphate-dependent enzyme [Burkholderiales bacterium]|nr:YggS family pyridoxal phosphate-dependent enzyme [Burkholderiales bacterium]
MTTIAARLQAVRSRIRVAALGAGRSPDEIGLIAVSKTFSPAAVAEACAAGQFAFGENYLQEALGKIQALSQTRPIGVAPGQEERGPQEGDMRSAGVASPRPLLLPLQWHDAPGQKERGPQEGDMRSSAGVASPQAGPLLLPLEWHFIGPIQSNKTRQIAEHFTWVHAVDRIKIAQRLAAARPATQGPLQICLQVNVSGEGSKSGVRPEEAVALAQALSQLPGLQLRGLMAIPEPTDDIVVQRARFRQVRQLKDEINRQGISLDTLSMGMSDDLEAAIAEGATLVRVGRAIFGERVPFTPDC